MSLTEIQNHFLNAANIQTSKIVATLAEYIATQNDILTLVSQVPLNRSPRTVFLAAVHAILLSGADHPLKEFYLSLGGKLTLTDDNKDEFCLRFRDFYQTYQNKLATFLSKNTQTNEVNRSFVILLGISEMISREPIHSLSLVEIGTSAGLLLNIDKFLFQFDGIKIGDPQSKLTLTTNWSGPLPDNLIQNFPQIKHKMGIDLNPLDISNPETLLWLKALIWPEHISRMQNLTVAAELFLENRDNVLLLKGSYEKYFDLIIEKARDSEAILIFSIWVLYQFSEADRQILHKHLETLAIKMNKRIYFLYDTWTQEVKKNRVDIFLKVIHSDGSSQEKKICEAAHHGEFINATRQA